MFQMLVGKPPFEGNTPVVLMHSHLNEPPPRPSAKVAEIPRKLDELIVNLMAKAPNDRPWDAAAVGVKLTDLRDKADKGAAIKMVWPSNGKGAASQPRALDQDGKAVATETPRKKSRKSTSSAGVSRSSQSRRERTGLETRAPWLNRSTLEVGLLALALVVIGGFITYWVWPPSALYLYKQAESLMASSRRSDRVTARDDYIQELDRRFPEHPYREQTQKWRDQILLEDAEGRASTLDKGRNTNLARPDGNTEHMFLIALDLAADAHKRGDDLTAIRQWQEFAQQVKDDPDERKWYLLALNRIEQVENEIRDRRLYVAKQIELANIAHRAGRTDEAVSIQNELIKKFRHFTDLADVFPHDATTTTGSESKNSPSVGSPPDESSDSPKPSATKKAIDPPSNADPAPSATATSPSSDSPPSPRYP